MKDNLVFFLISFCLLGLTSCFNPAEPEYIQSNLYAFGSVQDGNIFIEPDGLVFIVDDDKTDEAWKTQGRIFFCCDVLRQTTPSIFEIRLKSYEPVITPAVLAKSQSDEEHYGTDAVAFYQDWGFDPMRYTFNAGVAYTYLKDSDKEHHVTLVWDDVRSNRDTVFFELHHQGSGESYENTEYEATDFEMKGSYMTFDLSRAIPSDAASNLVISFEWDWFETGALQTLEREVVHQQAFTTLNTR